MTGTGERLDRASLRFIVAGGALSLLNLGLRFALDLAVPFRLAVGIAGGVTVTLSFFVYRSFVFRDTAAVSLRAVLTFLAVNLAGLATTIAVAAAVLAGCRDLVAYEIAATLGHGVGIIAGALMTFPLYRAFTFRPSK